MRFHLCQPPYSNGVDKGMSGEEGCGKGYCCCDTMGCKMFKNFCAGDEKLCSRKCWQFAMSSVFSLIVLGVAVIGLCGWFAEYDGTFYTNMITFIIGVWIPSPKLKKDKEEKQRSIRSRSSISPSPLDEEEEIIDI